MMVFRTSMRPKALHDKSVGSPMNFSCDLCNTVGEGRRFPSKNGREDWAVLPEDWDEKEDRRQNAKKPFLIICPAADCQHRAQEFGHVK